MQILRNESKNARPVSGRHMLPAGIAYLTLLIVALLISFSARAVDSSELTQMLERADSVKGTNRAEFKTIIESVVSQSEKLSPQQQNYLRYLQGWQFGYEGDYARAIELLNSVSAQSTDVTLRFRAHASTVNVLAIAKRHEEAFTQLSQMIELLPQVTDSNARVMGLQNAMLLYNQVGQYDLSLSYVDKLKSERLSGRSACIMEEMRVNALYKSKRLQFDGSEFQAALAVCESAKDVVFANLIRTNIARFYADQGRFADAISLLLQHYEAVQRTQYPPLISSHNSLLAHSYREMGDAALAKQYALRATASAVRNEYTEPLVAAYRLLYVLAKEQGDAKAALAYHEQYTAADKGYLNDVSARQLAYQRVTHEILANRMQIDTLNKQNEVLQLQQALSGKAVENIRLYIALLAVILIFIALWAYKTKRSQMHFMKLSRRDGLTGIFNRPHFIELAESTLKSARKNQQDVCVVLCDLDHFKSVNDNYGHAEGDYVLQRAVTACQMHLRASDVFARIGGEEFGLLLPACTMEDARGRVERLRLAVVESNPSDGKFKVSASFGISCASSSGYELQTLMTHADAALYQAKRSGRNCVVTYDAKDPAINGPRVVYVEGIRT